MDMLFADPPAQLRHQIIGLWSLRGNPKGLYSGLPKPFVEMIVSLSGCHYWQANENDIPLDFTQGWVTPVQSGPRFAQTHGPLHLIGARMSIASAAKLFGVDVNRDAGAPISLDCLLGSQASLLRERLLEVDSEAARLKVLGDWLSKRLKEQVEIALPTTDELISLGWQADALAGYFGLSSRGLRKRFKSKYGIGPKFWLQLNRFDNVLSSKLSSRGLADTAFKFGYTDQAHMTSDFKRFAGKTPYAYLKTRIATPAPEEAPHFVPNSN